MKNVFNQSPKAVEMKSEYDLLDERIGKFWHQTFKGAMEERILLKDLNLPLARIKRLMKVEEGVRMVASEVPVLFSMITEKFIEELTLRAWMNTEENKRRILQKSDLTAAVKTSEMYDFLIYIIPRNDLNRPFSQLVPNRMHGEHGRFGHGGQYENSSMMGEDMMSMQGQHVPQDFYIQQELQRMDPGSAEASGRSDSHTPQGLMGDEYGGGFDMGFHRDTSLDLSADMAPRPFN